jgi:hypothetical protein
MCPGGNPRNPNCPSPSLEDAKFGKNLCQITSEKPNKFRIHSQFKHPSLIVMDSTITAAFKAMPSLSTTYVGGQALPNSEAELAAYGNAMAEFVKDRASFNEAIEGLSRSQNRGQKRSHHGNGNAPAPVRGRVCQCQLSLFKTPSLGQTVNHKINSLIHITISSWIIPCTTVPQWGK